MNILISDWYVFSKYFANGGHRVQMFSNRALRFSVLKALVASTNIIASVSSLL